MIKIVSRNLLAINCTAINRVLSSYLPNPIFRIPTKVNEILIGTNIGKNFVYRIKT